MAMDGETDAVCDLASSLAVGPKRYPRNSWTMRLMPLGSTATTTMVIRRGGAKSNFSVNASSGSGAFSQNPAVARTCLTYNHPVR